MERPNINFVLLVVVGVIVTLYGPSMVQGEGPNDDTTSTDLNKQLNTLRTQLNSLDARLHTQQKEVNNRFNRMDGRLDGIETAIADMKTYVQNHNAAMETKMEWALTDGKQTPIPTPAGCEDAQAISGVYTIAPGQGTSMDVYCEQRLDGGGWTVFQSRKDGSVNFYRNWNTYKVGFGQWSSEFWLGNDRIHELTKHHDMKLKVELTSPAGEVKFADYNHFWIDDEAHKYKLTVIGYTGSSPPGDALAYHNGNNFTTRDQDDKYSGQCANTYKGAWWYNTCHHSNLNGLYGTTERYKGMNWKQWKGFSVSMKATRMMFRKRP